MYRRSLNDKRTNYNLFLRKRVNELAAMCKETGSGTEKELEKIKSKFAIQEGVRMERVEEYIEVLEGCELLTIFSGIKRWRYNPEEEWDNFMVNIK